MSAICAIALMEKITATNLSSLVNSSIWILVIGVETRAVFMPAMERSSYVALCWANGPKLMLSRRRWEGQVLQAFILRDRFARHAAPDGCGLQKLANQHGYGAEEIAARLAPPTLSTEIAHELGTRRN